MIVRLIEKRRSWLQGRIMLDRVMSLWYNHSKEQGKEVASVNLRLKISDKIKNELAYRDHLKTKSKEELIDEIIFLRKTASEIRERSKAALTI